MNLKYTVDLESKGKTVKHIVKSKLGLSERLLKRLKVKGKILRNSSPVFVNAIVDHLDIIEVILDYEEEYDNITPQNIPINIIFEDECLIVLNKQPHIVVHPTSSHIDGTIANAVLYHLIKKNEAKKIRPVSRLDKDTSGVIIFAKNEYVQEHLIRQMRDKTFKKEYIGIVQHTVAKETGTIDLPIERKPGSIMLRHVSPLGSPSITHFEVLERLLDATFLKFHLETGRTHQIRVHCQAIGHPLLGDTLYSDLPTTIITRQALHSHKAFFLHPLSQKQLEITADIPEDIISALEILRK